MEKKIKNLKFWKKKSKGSTLLISLIILSVVLVVGMIVSNTIIRDVVSNREFGESNYAYYAADMGLKKAIWLFNNEIYSNEDLESKWGYSDEDFFVNGVNMCPGSWNEVAQECPCPISLTGNCAVASSDPEELIIDGTINNANYKVYLKIIYNSGDSNGLNRTVYLTSVGSYGKVRRKLKYNTCIGNMCE